MSNDHISIQNVVGPVNVKTSLEHVKEIVTTFPAVVKVNRHGLSDFIEELKQTLEPTANIQPEDRAKLTE